MPAALSGGCCQEYAPSSATWLPARTCQYVRLPMPGSDVDRSLGCSIPVLTWPRGNR